MLFQQRCLFSALNVYENVAFPLRGDADAHPRVDDLVMLKLAMVELRPEHALLMPPELSGGMIKRVAFGAGTRPEPELLLLDEPTAGLDPDRSAGFVRLIRELQRQLGFTVVLVTHDLDTLAALSSRIAIARRRAYSAFGTLDEIVQIDDPFIERFFLASAVERRLPVAGGELMENRGTLWLRGCSACSRGRGHRSDMVVFGRLRAGEGRYLLVSNGNITGLNIQARLRFRGIQAGKVELAHSRINADNPSRDPGRSVCVTIFRHAGRRRVSVIKALPVSRSFSSKTVVPDPAPLVANGPVAKNRTSTGADRQGQRYRPRDTQPDRLRLRNWCCSWSGET